MLIDSHCHLQSIEHIALEQVLSNCKTNGVEKLLTVSINASDAIKLQQIVSQYQQIYMSVGIHPCCTELEFNEFDTLKPFITNEKVIAVGETGLDFFKGENKDPQVNSFIRHIELANQYDKALIIHTRNAPVETYNTLKREQAKKGVIHCFTENKQACKRFLDLGFYISFAGIVTFKNATELKEIAKYVPMDRLLVETDSPYLAPVPYRGKSNEPSFVKYVATEIAHLKGVSFESVAKATTKNFNALFL